MLQGSEQWLRDPDTIEASRTFKSARDAALRDLVAVCRSSTDPKVRDKMRCFEDYDVFQAFLGGKSFIEEIKDAR